MGRLGVVRVIRCAILLLVIVGSLVGAQVALAAQENGLSPFILPPGQEQPIEILELSSTYPILRGVSGDSFEFEVAMSYIGSEPRVFELLPVTPPKWSASIKPSVGSGELGAIELEPMKSYPDRVKVNFAPLAGNRPEPGEYTVTLEVSSGSLRETIDLKAVITANYEFTMLTSTGRLNTEVTAGKDNHLSLLLLNTGSAAIENIRLSSSKPEGWNIAFTPDKIDSLEPGFTQEVDVVINPPSETIAGDYNSTLYADSTEVSENLRLRVTVLTPTIWGWVGILIVLVVIAGVGVIFWRLGRR